MSNLEKRVNETESVQENWLKKRNVSSNILNEVEGSLDQMISDIEDKRVRYILNYCVNKEICSKEQIMKEINYYYTSIEPKLSSDPYLRHIFNLIALNNTLVVNEQSLPTNLDIQLNSEISKRQSIEEDLLKLAPDVRRLVEISLEHILPSIVRLEIDKIVNREEDSEEKSIYEELAEITNPDEKEVVENWLKRWLRLSFVLEEWQDYKIIRDETDEQVRSLAKAYINKWNTRDNAVRNIDGFRKIAWYWKDTVEYIIGLINEWEENYYIDNLLFRAHAYNNSH